MYENINTNLFLSGFFYFSDGPADFKSTPNWIRSSVPPKLLTLRKILFKGFIFHYLYYQFFQINYVKNFIFDFLCRSFCYQNPTETQAQSHRHTNTTNNCKDKQTQQTKKQTHIHNTQSYRHNTKSKGHTYLLNMLSLLKIFSQVWSVIMHPHRCPKGHVVAPVGHRVIRSYYM